MICSRRADASKVSIKRAGAGGARTEIRDVRIAQVSPSRSRLGP